MLTNATLSPRLNTSIHDIVQLNVELDGLNRGEPVRWECRNESWITCTFKTAASLSAIDYERARRKIDGLPMIRKLIGNFLEISEASATRSFKIGDYLNGRECQIIELKLGRDQRNRDLLKAFQLATGISGSKISTECKKEPSDRKPLERHAPILVIPKLTECDEVEKDRIVRKLVKEWVADRGLS